MGPRQSAAPGLAVVSDQIERWVTGRWDWILQQLGIEAKFLVNRHGPCPLCGGDDRFRYDNKKGKGTWYCNGCGHGDGFKLAQEYTGKTFAQVATMIRKMRGDAPEAKAFTPEVDMRKRQQNLNKVWRSCRSPDLVDAYLDNRGIPPEVRAKVMDLRGHEALGLYENGKKIGELPALVAMIRDKLGRPLTLHRTYLAPNGMREKKIMPALATIMGGATRLVAGKGQSLIIAEGIETALSMKAMMTKQRDASVWAAISANGLAAVDLPKDTEQLIIAVDNDSSFTGAAAGFELARRAKVKEKIPDVQLFMPTRADADMNDVHVSPGSGYISSRGSVGIHKWEGAA